MSALPVLGSSPSAGAVSAQSGGDLVRSYLRDIGRVPLLSHEQEITLGRQVQELVGLEELELELEVRLGNKP
ncbi:RNA polymerase sigma factor, RpoD/SigA family, partial [Cyanobium sp. BA5m-10]